MPSVTNALRLLSDPTRLRLLLLLEQGELSVAELQEILGMGQSRISTHLAQLRREGLVLDRRSGKNILYAFAVGNSDFAKLISELLSQAVPEIPEFQGDLAALRLIRSKRQDRAREYFNKLAGKFGKNHCPGRSWQALAHSLLELIPPMVIADLGAGEGTMSQLLARKAKLVIAVDSSEKMVEFGARLAKEHGIDNLEYRLGDLQDPPIEPESVDLVILSQALHHAESPAAAIVSAFKIAKPGGRLMILDLLSHQFEQARELYADQWLGFSEVDLLRMCDEAGFRNIEVGVVSREEEPPYFSTLLVSATK